MPSFHKFMIPFIDTWFPYIGTYGKLLFSEILKWMANIKFDGGGLRKELALNKQKVQQGCYTFQTKNQKPNIRVYS